MAKARILVIEDEKEERENICQFLEFEDYETLQAEDGEEGIEMAKKHLPDLILCDFKMPRKDGHQVLKELKKEPRTWEIPFIFLTIYGNKKEIVEGFDLGAQDYISKPFYNKELLARVKNLVELKEKTDKLKEMIERYYQTLKKLKKEQETLVKQIEKQNPVKEKELEIADLKGQMKAMDKFIKDLMNIKKGV